MPASTPTASTLAQALAIRKIASVRAAELKALPRLGLAHAHWRIGRSGLLLRVPLVASVDVNRQADAFRLLEPSGHTPRLKAVLLPDAALPFGALVVQEIRGRSPRVPADLRAIAVALAAIHGVAVPPENVGGEPFIATLAVIERNFAAGRRALAPEARKLFAAELDWARHFAKHNATALRDAQRTPVLTDAHPRNFVINRRGRAIAVDLEKVLIGAPEIDLAHTLLPAAIAWGRSGERVTAADRQRFLDTYVRRRDPAGAVAIFHRLPALQRLTWLRTTAAFAAIKTTEADRQLDPAARTVARRAIRQALDLKTLMAARRAWAGA
jgi:hypothetical protein